MKLLNLNQIVSINAHKNTVVFSFSNGETIELVSQKYNCDNFIIMESFIAFFKKCNCWIDTFYLTNTRFVDSMIEDSLLNFENGYKNELLDQYKLENEQL